MIYDECDWGTTSREERRADNYALKLLTYAEDVCERSNDENVGWLYIAELGTIELRERLLEREITSYRAALKWARSIARRANAEAGKKF